MEVLKPEHLRWGNCIRSKSDKVIEQVIKIEKNKINACNYTFFEPIPLTEEWFNNYGLLKTNGISFLLGCYEIIRSKDDMYWCVILKGGVIARLKYIHQLQNLYYALTGEELKLTNK